MFTFLFNDEDVCFLPFVKFILQPFYFAVFNSAVSASTRPLVNDHIAARWPSLAARFRCCCPITVLPSALVFLLISLICTAVVTEVYLDKDPKIDLTQGNEGGCSC